MGPSDPRQILDCAIRTQGHSYSRLARLLGRNAAYIQQFIKRGTPARLAERDRRLLADYLGLDEAELGGDGAAERRSIRFVPRLEVKASAGPGSLPGGEKPIAEIGFDRAWLRHVCRASDEDLSIISVEGDSMTPTLVEGDDILIDQSAGARRLRDGIYVMRRDDALTVKRICVSPAGTTLSIVSDNAAYPTWPDCPIDSIDVVGRVVWAGRRFS